MESDNSNNIKNFIKIDSVDNIADIELGLRISDPQIHESTSQLTLLSHDCHNSELLIIKNEKNNDDNISLNDENILSDDDIFSNHDMFSEDRFSDDDMDMGSDSGILMVVNNKTQENKNDEDENASQNDDISQEEENSTFCKFLKGRKKNYFVNILSQVSLHILLLSIFETLLFFIFISDIEFTIFMQKIAEYLNIVSNTQEDFYYDGVGQEGLYYVVNNELNSPEMYDYIERLEEKYYHSLERRDEYNDRLRDKMIFVTFMLLITFIGIVMLTFTKYKISLPKLFFEHILLLIFIAVYEIWFFLNIVLNYKSITSDELNYIFVTCILKNTDNNNDQINIDRNITSQCIL